MQAAHVAPTPAPLPRNGWNTPAATVTVTAPNISELVGSNFDIPVTVSDTTGDGIISYQFDLIYDPTVITPQAVPVSTTGTLSSGMFVTYNVPSPGLLKVVVFGVNPIAGAGTLFDFEFTATGSDGALSPLTWQNFMFNEGDPANAVTNGSVHLVSPTAAGVSVGGQVTDSNGQALPRVEVTLIDSEGQVRQAITSPFGYYRFDNVLSGFTYILGANSKGHRFASRVIAVNEDVSDADIVSMN